MRWENLMLDGAAPDRPAIGQLPLGLPDAVVRTFDTPGFAGMTFYEVRAKSAINRVPAVSRVPFEWTINPYRGCSHACAYCLAGDTPILMADGRTMPLADLRVGDKIYGTMRQGAYRRFVITEVLDHWVTSKPAFRVTLADGTALVASGDHQFLTNRGWKHVIGAMAGSGRRPYLTPGNKLIGTGHFAQQPKDTQDYRRGYLCGMIRGDANLGTYTYPYGTVHRFRLALTDDEALGRARDYLLGFGITTTEFSYVTSGYQRTPMRAIRTSTGQHIRRIAELISWPDEPGSSWTAGFLAGIFDAEGSHSQGVLRIVNSDAEIIDHIVDGMREFGFRTVTEQRGAMSAVRLVGGLSERLRFMHTVDPAISRKRLIAGTAFKTFADLRVVSVEPLGLQLPLYDITTGTGDFIADGVVSHNCFARNTHTYLDLDAGHDFDSKIVVKVNVADVLRRELAAPKWRGGHIAMGTNVDCYQRAEGRYRLMPGIIGALSDFANPFSILTKGTLITRDLDLLRRAAEVTDVGVSFSVGFVDEALWRTVEPGTPSPRRRLDAVRQFADAGFAVGVLMAPILPGLTDTEESIDATAAAIVAAGAASVTPITLHLRPGAREWYAGWLTRTHPDLAARYRTLYGRGSYAPKDYQREISARVRAATRRHGLAEKPPREHRGIDRSPAPPAAEQLTLL